MGVTARFHSWETLPTCFLHSMGAKRKLDSLRFGARRQGRPYQDRRVDTRHPRERFLIVCEGEKTEPNYFRGFRVPKDVIEIEGTGKNTLSVVDHAIDRKQDGEYDQVWCVFDRDSFPAKQFNAALEKAKENGIRVAYSNEAFEIWYLLHFNYYDSALSRKQYKEALSGLLKSKYEKNSGTIYRELESLQGKAIRNAAKLLQSHKPLRPESNNPSTTVHLLVLELNRFIDF